MTCPVRNNSVMNLKKAIYLNNKKYLKQDYHLKLGNLMISNFY